MTELTFLKEFMLIRQANQKSAILVTIGIFLDKGFKFQPDVCKGCHDVLMISMNLSDFAILNIKSADYCCIVSGISNSEAVNLLQKADLKEKKWNIIKHKIYYHI